MRPRIPANLGGLIAPKSGIRWVTNSSFQPKSPSSLGSSLWPRTESIRIYEILKKYQEVEQMLEENRKAAEKLNAMGMNHLLESIERSITMTKWFRIQAQEDCKSHLYSVEKYLLSWTINFLYLFGS